MAFRRSQLGTDVDVGRCPRKRGTELLLLNGQDGQGKSKEEEVAYSIRQNLTPSLPPTTTRSKRRSLRSAISLAASSGLPVLASPRSKWSLTKQEGPAFNAPSTTSSENTHLFFRLWPIAGPNATSRQNPMQRAGPTMHKPYSGHCRRTS
jgi:hypothetical protein